MPWPKEIVAEIAKTFAQALKITFYLFWWTFLLLVAAARKLGVHIQDFQLHQPRPRAQSRAVEAVVCPQCHTENEAAASHCFRCGRRLE